MNSLQEKVCSLSVKNKGLLDQLSEAKRRQAEIECKVSVSAVGLYTFIRIGFCGFVLFVFENRL